MTGVSCKQFGVTFHKNMDLKTMVKQWAKVTPEVKAQNPTLNVIMNQAQSVLSVQQTVIGTTTQAQEVLNEATDASLLIANPAFAGPQAADEAAKAAQAAQNAAVEQVRQQVLGQLC